MNTNIIFYILHKINFIFYVNIYFIILSYDKDSVFYKYDILIYNIKLSVNISIFLYIFNEIIYKL